MWWRKQSQDDAVQAIGEAVAQARELLDPYTDRTYAEEPFSDRVVMQPGKMLDKLRERMERAVLDPLNLEIAVEDFLTFDEVSLLVSTGFGGLLVHVTAEHAADLLAREFPPDLASRPIVSYDLRTLGLHISDEIQATARDILNSQTSQDPRRTSGEVDEQVLDLDAADQVTLYVAVLTYYLRKLNLLAEMTSQP